MKELSAPYKGSCRNITIENFFTTLPLSDFLLSWILITVGTLRKNKKYIPAEMKPSKIRDEYSTVFGFQKTQPNHTTAHTSDGNSRNKSFNG